MWKRVFNLLELNNKEDRRFKTMKTKENYVAYEKKTRKVIKEFKDFKTCLEFIVDNDSKENPLSWANMTHPKYKELGLIRLENDVSANFNEVTIHLLNDPAHKPEEKGEKI